MSDILRKARESALESNEKTFREEAAFGRGYLAAAKESEREIAELRARVAELRAQVKDAGAFMAAKLAEIAELHAEEDRLRARVAKLEGKLYGTDSDALNYAG
jgi:chromosome segregation ATPase